MDALDAAALIDRAVDDHRARAHRSHDVVGHDHRRAAARHEHCADDEVGLGHHPCHRGAGARDRLDAAPVDLVDPAQLVEVAVEHQHLGLHALRDPRRAPPHRPRAEDDHPGRPDTRRAAEQDSASALASLEEVRAELRCHAPGDLAHRHEQWELAVGALHGLVRDADRARVEQRVGDLRVRGQVEVREQHESGAQVADLVGLRFLDLQDESRALPHLVGRRHDLGARAPVVVVADTGVVARARLDQDAHPVVRHLVHTVGSDRDAMFVGLQLARNTDDERTQNFPPAANHSFITFSHSFMLYTSSWYENLPLPAYSNTVMPAN